MSNPFQDYNPATPITAAWLNGVDTIINGPNGLPSANGAGNIGYGSQTLDAILKNQFLEVVNSVTALKAIDKTRFTQAFLTGYYAAGDGGGGPFYLDAADTTSLDNGGTIFVASDGGRWKREYAGAINVKWFGAKGDGTTDDTSTMQAAINFAGIGGTVFAPKSVYKINGTLNLLQGQIFHGSGWSTTTGSFAVAGGTVIKQFNTGDIPAINVPGTSESNQFENVHIRDLAIVNNVSSSNASGIHAAYARKFKATNLYITGFRRGIYLEVQCWAWGTDHCLIMDCNLGIWAGSASEDCLISNCDIGLFRSLSSGATEGTSCIFLANQIQNCTILSTGMHFCDWAVTLNQGDTNGNGTGTPYPMQASMIGGYIEDCKIGGIAILSSNGNASALQHPTFNMQDTRVFNGGAYATINNGQPILYIAHASQVRVNNIQESGFSYGAILGQTYGGISFFGNQPKNVMWGQDANYTYGTARFLGNINCVSRVPGSNPICALKTTATSITTSGGFGNPQWNSVISDAYSWGNLTTFVITPGKNQLVRIRASIYVQATTNGSRYAVMLNKNGSQIATLMDIQASGTNPLILQGEYYDTPNGTGDYYAIQFYSDSGGGNATIPIVANGTNFAVEVIGS